MLAETLSKRGTNVDKYLEGAAPSENIAWTISATASQVVRSVHWILTLNVRIIAYAPLPPQRGGSKASPSAGLDPRKPMHRFRYLGRLGQRRVPFRSAVFGFLLKSDQRTFL